MIRKLFSGQINSITVAALLVALSSLLSRILGIFRDRILAGEFGAGDILDIYYASFRVPDLIFNLLILGALSAGFIPIFTGLIKAKDGESSFFSKEPNKEAWILASNVLNIMMLALLFLSVLGIIFSPIIVKIISPGFSPSKQDITISITRIMFLSPIFLGISGILGGVLQSFKRFFVYSLSPILYNIGIIIGALYFVPRWGIYGLAWGVVLGAFLHMLVQLPATMSLGFKYFPRIDFKNKNVREICVMMVPRTMSLAISQINLVAITIVASTLQSGSLTIFTLANNLQSFPVGIFGISFAVAAFPTMAAVAFRKEKLVENFSNIFRQILFFIAPFTVLLLTLRAQIIRVVLGAGNFDWEDTILTINALSFFTISLFAQAALPLMVRMFYARHNSKTPFFIGLFSVASNIVLILFLPKIVACQTIIGVGESLVSQCQPLGVAGLALAFSISSILNFIMLWIALRFEVGDLDEARILKSAVKFTLASLACGITVQITKLIVGHYADMEKTWGVFTQGFTAGIFGILVYILFCLLFKSEELFSFWSSFRRRIPWKKVETGDRGEARGI
ncbi:MAG: murein biosynthesis integral membrane protein MurJ [bacterium]